MKGDKNINPLRWLSGFRGDTRLAAPCAIVIAGGTLALLMVTICAIVLYQSRLDAMPRATETSRNLVLLAERDIERSFELYALSLQAVVDRVNDPEVASTSPRLRGFALFDHAATATYLGSMLVLDAQGNIVIDAANDVPRRANFSDREYFKVHRDSPNIGLYVGDPYASRLRGGALSIPLSRRLSRPDGSFPGVVLIAV